MLWNHDSILTAQWVLMALLLLLIQTWLCLHAQNPPSWVDSSCSLTFINLPEVLVLYSSANYSNIKCCACCCRILCLGAVRFWFVCIAHIHKHTHQRDDISYYEAMSTGRHKLFISYFRLPLFCLCGFGSVYISIFYCYIDTLNSLPRVTFTR